jgi:glucokinase
VGKFSKDNLVCAVDLGGTNLRAANIDRDGRIHERLRSPTPHSNKPEDVVSGVAAAVHQCETEALQRGARIKSVSVVVPGTVHLETGLVFNSPNVSSLEGFKLGSALTSALDRPVLLENDANAAALGEMWQGAARGQQTIICLTLGTGVGGGVILDGKLWRGIDGTAGELGHASVEPFGGVQCKCGNVGCLEVYASATAVVRMTRESLAQHPGSSLHSVLPPDLTSEKIYGAAMDGDVLALEVFRRMGAYLGIAMASFVNIFNPQMIVIGGGVAAAWEMFAQHARAEMQKRAFPIPVQRCRVERAERGDEAGLLGAAWLALECGDLSRL